MWKIGLLVVGTSLLFASCKKEFDGETTIKLEQSLSNSDIKVTFKSYSDTRCPTGSNCVTQGFTQVELDLESLTQNFNGGCVLGGENSPHPQECTFLDYKIEYIDLTPHPSIEETIKDKDIRLKIHIEKM